MGGALPVDGGNREAVLKSTPMPSVIELGNGRMRHVLFVEGQCPVTRDERVRVTVLDLECQVGGQWRPVTKAGRRSRSEPVEPSS